MAAAVRAGDLRSRHAVARIDLGDDARERRRLDEARPPGSRVELRLGLKQLAAATRAPVDPGCVLVPVRTGERTLRSLATQDLVLLGREALAPLLVAQLCLRNHDPS